jgi:ABC-type Fe3+-hydroxamate transport system substrate-binding protein
VDALVDAVGTRHSVAAQPARIVSLVPSITELVCALGLANQLVGRTGFCVHPHDTVRRIPKVGGTKDVDLDAVRALRPTHVIVNIDENRRETAAALAQFVPQVIVTHPLAPEDNVALYRLIGGIFDRADSAERLVVRLRDAMQACQAESADLPRERVLYLIWRDPWMTVSRETYIARTLALVGWETVPASAAARYPTIALDAPILAEVQVVLLSSEPYRFTARHVAELAARDALAGKRVALIDGEMTSWYGARATDGMRYLPRFRRGLSGHA